MSRIMDPTVGANLLLAVQAALLGAVPSNLRAVTCGWEADRLKLRFILDGPVAEDDAEEMRIVGANVASHFPEPWTIHEEIVRLDFPEPLQSYCLDSWAYMRREGSVT